MGVTKMGGWRLWAPRLVILLWLISLPVFAEPVVAEKADVRVLIDISGSMKQNDPKNLRRPALRLLVGLLPKDTRAGVWTFAQYANMQIPLAQVDEAWREKALASSRKIGSPGQFTHIEEALLRATKDWWGPPRQLRRSVVLLTDGMVDISKDEAKNLASRRRILEQVIPRCQALGVAVHTIALSKNADHELMRELAESTDGWYEQVNNAEQLQKVFLRIFEKVGRPDTIPLQDNKFTVDASVTEATVLVFHRPDAQPTQLIPPGGDPYGVETAPQSINWHRDQGYDMLTIKEPQTGEWKIVAEVDPDNRVIVVTDLRMQSTELPNRLIQGQSLALEVTFTDHGRLIRKPAFLSVLNVSATQQDGAGKTESWPLLDNGRMADPRAGDGRFTLQFGGDALPRGSGELVINAKSQTFEREKRMTYEVVPPVILEARSGEQSNQLLVEIRPDEALVDSPTMQTAVWLEDEHSQRFSLEMTMGADGAGRGIIDLLTFSGSRRIFVQATGKTKQGEALKYTDSPIEVEGLLPVSSEVAVASAAEPQLVEQEIAAVAEAAAGQQVEQSGWMSTAGRFALFNLVLLVAGGTGSWWLRKLNGKQLVLLVEEEEPAKHGTPEEKAA